MRNIFISITVTATLFTTLNGAETDLIIADVTRYTETASSFALKDAKVSYDVPAISYMAIRPNYLLLATLRVIPQQHIGSTALGSMSIDLEQKAWKYEFSTGYKFYLNEDLFIAPALLFSDYYSTLYKIAGSRIIETNSHDIDLRLYGLVGYKLAKATMLFLSVELDNDLLSNKYSDDYSQYPINATVYQFLSKKWFVYAKYQHTIRDKEAQADSTGNINSIGYGVGAGFSF